MSPKYLLPLLLILIGCASQKKLAYLNNFNQSEIDTTFRMEVPEYRVQIRDILHITIKSMTPDGRITDFLLPSGNNSSINLTQSESGGFIYGYDVKPDGSVIIPVIGPVNVKGLTLEASRASLQEAAAKVFKNPTVECKLLSFKFTVIGEVKAPGTYINYNNYLTILEAIGRAGGIGDFGRRDRVLVIRPTENGTQTYSLNLQDKNLLSSTAYFLLPNDVVVVEPGKHKIFNLNLPTLTFMLTTVTSAITSTVLLINYLGR